MRHAALMLAAAILADAGAASAQPTELTNARVEVQQAGADLGATFAAAVEHAATPSWVGLAVPMAPGDQVICDWSDRGSRPISTGAVKLEGPQRLHVLFRLEDHRVSRIRMFSEGCTLDAGGLPVTWLTSAVPSQTVRLLATFLDESAPRRIADQALSVLGVHGDPSAADLLLRTAASGRTSQLRGQALFWVAQRAGARAAPAIAEAIARDPDTEVKKRAVFALSQLPKDEGVPRLIEVAREHSNAAVRRQAMFWLGQSNDSRALKFFEEILRR